MVKYHLTISRIFYEKTFHLVLILEVFEDLYFFSYSTSKKIYPD